MRTLMCRPAIHSFLALTLLAATATAQQGAHATLIPQASRTPAPAFQSPDPSGTNKQLTDYTGKVVLLNFWATACGNCQLEIPWLIDLESARKSAPFTIVGVSMDTSYEGARSPDQAWPQVKPFVAAHHLNYPILLGDAMLLVSYKIQAVPATYLIDRHGRIAATYAGVADKADVTSNVDKLLAEQ